jgi:hypothetical protein
MIAFRRAISFRATVVGIMISLRRLRPALL